MGNCRRQNDKEESFDGKIKNACLDINPSRNLPVHLHGSRRSMPESAQKILAPPAAKLERFKS